MQNRLFDFRNFKQENKQYSQERLFEKFIIAVATDDVKKVNKLLHYGLDPSFTTEGTTLLNYAITFGSEKIALLLINSGADVHAITKGASGSEVTALEISIFQPIPSVIKKLIEAGIDPNRECTSGDSEHIGPVLPTWQVFALLGHKDIVECILENYPSLQLNNSTNFSIIELLQPSAHPEVVDFYKSLIDTMNKKIFEQFKMDGTNLYQLTQEYLQTKKAMLQAQKGGDVLQYGINAEKIESILKDASEEYKSVLTGIGELMDAAEEIPELTKIIKTIFTMYDFINKWLKCLNNPIAEIDSSIADLINEKLTAASGMKISA